MKHFLFLSLFLVLFRISAFAQIQPGCFKIVDRLGVEKNTFCKGDTVFVENCYPNPGITTVYDFGNGLGFGLDTKFVYTASGTYTIRQDGTNQLGIPYSLNKDVTIVDFPDPQFNLFACTANRAFVEITDTNYNSYSVNFGDTSPPVALTSGATYEHNYAATGTYTVTVTGIHSASGCTNTTTKTITTIIQYPTPVLEKVEIIGDPGTLGTIKLLVTAEANLNYQVFFRPVNSTTETAGITFQPTQSGTYAVTFTPINNQTQGCFRIQVIDNCAGSVIPFSNEICSVSLTAQAFNQYNQVSWQSYASAGSGLQQYRLYKDGAVIGTFNASQTSYKDNNVVCGRQYCYKVEADITPHGLSVSNIGCVTGTSSQTPGGAALQASFNFQNTIDVTLYTSVNSDVKALFPERSLNGEPFETLPQKAGKIYQDWDTSATNTSYCYQAKYTDNCGNTSPLTNITCPVLMQGQISQGPGLNTEVSVSWTNYSGFTNGVRQYFVEIYSPDFQLIKSIPVGLVNAYTDVEVTNAHQLLLYRIMAEPVLPSEPLVYSNYRKFSQEFAVNIPSAFTPNGDNLNDVFEVKGNFFSSFQLTVRSRTGQVVFESKGDKRSWDGTVNGKPANPDAYVYQFSGIAFSGLVIQKVGTVTLLR